VLVRSVCMCFYSPQLGSVTPRVSSRSFVFWCCRFWTLTPVAPVWSHAFDAAILSLLPLCVVICCRARVKSILRGSS
jgi:hypothetical protein